MTTEEMMAEARVVANRLKLTRRGLFLMSNKELTVLLMDAYAQGVAVQSRRAVQAFAPQMMGQYDSLVRG